MSNKQKAVILAAGGIDHRHLPVGGATSNAMIPVNGKPVIGWILDDLLRKEVNEAIVVLLHTNKGLIEYLTHCYKDKMVIDLAFVSPGLSILNSLFSALPWFRENDQLLLVLGDTLITDELPSSPDFIFVGPYEVPEKWCLVKSNIQSEVEEFKNKPIDVQGDYKAVCGLYGFSDVNLLRNICIQLIRNNAWELHQLLEGYNEKIKIRTIEVDRWFDFGHSKDLYQAQTELLQSRYFNSLHIDKVRGVLKKTSAKTGKLKNELSWYQSLPEHLKIFTPRLVSVEPATGGEGENVTITQEYYGYPNLAEMWVYSELDADNWYVIIDNLLNVIAEFHKEENDHSNADDAHSMYWSKTRERLDDLGKNDFWAPIINNADCQINGRSYKNIPVLLDLLEEDIAALSTNYRSVVIHGDFCLSNILYDINKQITRVIDPRGSFGPAGIYGDARYDMAKLSHSLSGGYDHILAGYNSATYGDGEFTYATYRTTVHEQVILYFSNKLKENQILREIKLIEGLLFLSMLPYHADHPDRQRAMFCEGIQILNEIIEKE